MLFSHYKITRDYVIYPLIPCVRILDTKTQAIKRNLYGSYENERVITSLTVNGKKQTTRTECIERIVPGL